MGETKRLHMPFRMDSVEARDRQRRTKEGRVSIQSHAFGRVILTDADAKKFKAQATYGRAKQAAKSNVAEGVRLSRSLTKSGSVKLKLKAAG
jgi:hypothetical protein